MRLIGKHIMMEMKDQIATVREILFKLAGDMDDAAQDTYASSSYGGLRLKYDVDFDRSRFYSERLRYLAGADVARRIAECWPFEPERPTRGMASLPAYHRRLLGTRSAIVEAMTEFTVGSDGFEEEVCAVILRSAEQA